MAGRAFVVAKEEYFLLVCSTPQLAPRIFIGLYTASDFTNRRPTNNISIENSKFDHKWERSSLKYA